MPEPQLVCFLLLASSCFISGTDGYYFYRWKQCYCSSRDLSDMVYIEGFYFNKMKFAVFNSTVGKYIGYSKYGVWTAEGWNNDPAELKRVQALAGTFCKHNAGIYIPLVLDKSVKPKVRLSLVRPSSGGHPAMLMCSAYDFYPKMIRVKWYRDDQEVTTGDEISSEDLMDGDWYYQMHSHLELTPKAGEKITCVVEHISLKIPLEITWDSSMPEPEKNKVAIGSAALVLGLVICAAGLLYYRKKSQGWILVPPR
ncbi:rano class II histocompatibility antigen, A beta chain-like [Alosa pseudoharengus]|uniref:rano class II histocompatibility antigen, A beta chain-like n=1 Tax=Alosa pseudoharengus TaxID=34774 RepID=UPI003F8A7553